VAGVFALEPSPDLEVPGRREPGELAELAAEVGLVEVAGARVVWRVEQDEAGDYLIEVAAVWAVGYRKDSEVYAEIRQRVANAGSSPKTRALSETLELFAKQARDLTATPEPGKPEPVPKWLADALLYVVHIPASRVEEMSLEEAEKAWADHISGTGTGV
jgi:hypothetical protein